MGKITHGGTIGGKSPEYRIWVAMIKRCGSHRDSRYADYGGRGIAVCARWRHDFAAFLADMGKRPSAAHSIERRDGSVGYEPGNCRWADNVEQSRNRRSNVRIAFGGETLCATEWAERTGIHYRCLLSRIKSGWDVARVLTTPSSPAKHRKSETGIEWRDKGLRDARARRVAKRRRAA